MTFRSALAACATLLLPAALHGQGWTVDAAVGRAVHDPVSARIQSTVASLGLSYQDPQFRWLYLSAGTPLADPGPAWGAAGAGAWVGTERGEVTLGASLGTDVFGYGAFGGTPGGGGGTVEVTPTLVLRRGIARAELSSGFIGTLDLVGDSTAGHGFHDSVARLALTPTDGVEVGGEARYLRGSAGSWPYAGGSVQLQREWGGAWAYAGKWLASDLPAPTAAFGVGGSLRILDRTELVVAWRQEPLDPVYWSTPRRSWSLQLSRGIGPRPASPAKALFPDVSGGVVTFRLPREGAAAAPSVVGDFTGWQPVSMTAEGAFWVARLPVAPGVHHYGFRTAEGAWLVPSSLPTVDDAMGGKNAVLVVQ